MTNLDSNIKKQRHHFDNKGPSSQSYGFSSSHVCMWELDHKECWASKNWCFGIVLEKILESPLDCKIKPVILKEINLEYWMEGLMMKLTLQYFVFVSMLQYFGHPMWEASSLEKTLMLGNIEGKRRGQQRMRWLDSITDLMDMNLSILWQTGRIEEPGMLQFMVSQSWTWLSDWVRTTRFPKFIVGKITSVILVAMESSSPFLFRNFINALYSCNKRADSTWPREQSWRPT